MTPIRHWSFSSSTQLAFGWGAVRELSSAVRRYGWRRVLLLTDPVLARLPMMEAVCEPLRRAGAEPILFDGGYNLYMYAGNDPVNRMDPDGREWEPFEFPDSPEDLPQGDWTPDSDGCYGSPRRTETCASSRVTTGSSASCTTT